MRNLNYGLNLKTFRILLGVLFCLFSIGLMYRGLNRFIGADIQCTVDIIKFIEQYFIPGAFALIVFDLGVFIVYLELKYRDR